MTERIPDGRAQCPCCDYYSLNARGAREVCPVCYWEDDGHDLDSMDESSQANHITLRTARRNFEAIGASDHAAVGLVASAEARAGLRREVRATFH